MQMLTIINFGPITKFSFSPKRVNILIGKQASGKSTIAKLMYFSKMLTKWLTNFDPDMSNSKNYFESYSKYVKQRFLDLFGPTYHLPQFEINFTLSVKEDKHIKIGLHDQFLDIKYSRNLREEIESTLKDVVDFRKSQNNLSQGLTGLVSTSPLNEDPSILWRKIIEKANKTFCESRSPLFIPAGRSLLAILSDQLANVDATRLDFIMRDFLQAILRLRPQFNDSLENIEILARRTWGIQPDQERASLARTFIFEILRGRYIFTEGSERIYVNSSQYTQLRLASSGQQESVWILLMTYMLILERQKVFVVYEEPEAHLFPEGQDSIVKLLMLMSNIDDNQLIITTHSPYILSSLNNLIYANTVGTKNQEQRDAVRNIVPEKIWTPYQEVTAFFLDHEPTDICVDELKLLKSEAIDDASYKINTIYDEILAHDN
ncbi:AAA family ATPase [Solidesulfovibrio sp.]